MLYCVTVFFIAKIKEVKALLRKPALQYPHAEIVNPTDIVNFQCELQSSGKIGKARLMIDDNNYEYYFDDFDNSGDNSPTITENNYSSLITYPIKSNDSATYKIYKSNDQRTNKGDGVNEIPFSFGAGEMYTWKMRIYERDSFDPTKEKTYVPSSWIGKGTVMQVYRNSYDERHFGTSETELNGKQIIRINPHTQIYFKDCVGENMKYLYENLWSRYDSNAKYYIKVGNKFTEIQNWYYFLPVYKKTTINSNEIYNQQLNIDKDKDLDTYGEPKFGYAVIDDKEFDVSVNDTYTIYCNYIDTDQYYFDTNTPPTITLYENFESVNGTNVTREIDLSENTQLAPLSLSYSNLHITGEYLQSEGISVSHYSFLLERRESDTKYSTVSYSNNIYSTNIDWQYDKFISGNEYRLTLSLTDSVGSTFEKIIYIKAEYNSISYPMNIKIEEYRKHNSLIVDFSELHSITANEEIEGGHQFLAYNEDTDKIDTTLTVPNNVCHLDKGNSLTYDFIDGEKELSFGKSTIYTTFRIDSDYTGTIFEVTDDDETTTALKWDGVNFYLSVKNPSTGYSSYGRVFTPYENWDNMTVGDQKKAINEAMAKEIVDYSVPYLYMNGKIKYDDDLYYHTETPLSEQTWLVIIDTKTENVYFKNMSQKDNKTVGGDS